jgi:hypothetical protein
VSRLLLTLAGDTQHLQAAIHPPYWLALLSYLGPLKLACALLWFRRQRRLAASRPRL